MELTRDRLVRRLAEDLIGPKFAVDEVIDERPTGRYLTAILYPQQSAFSEDEDESLGGENGAGSLEDEDEQAEEVALFRSFKPSTCGFSFAYEGGPEGEIELTIDFARYTAETEPSEADEKDAASGAARSKRRKTLWRRHPRNHVVVFAVDDTSPLPQPEPGLRLYKRTVRRGNVRMVTLQFVNEFVEAHGPAGDIPPELIVDELVSREEAAFMQFHAAVRCRTGAFVPRPPVFRGGDEDQEISDLIYRDVCEYAVGHTCSAAWDDVDGEGPPATIEISWMPSSVVRRMDPAGDPALGAAIGSSPLGSLDALKLALAPKDAVLATLRALSTGYGRWIEARKSQAAELGAPGQRDRADLNLARCNEALLRMEKGIDLLARDEAALAAFRLANRAMYLQAGWAARKAVHLDEASSEDFAFGWYPFQLAFVLLCLESAFDREHPDRAVFDLIWFPTGGGKTEAYLLLAAFVLFARRLKHGERGAGLSVFMRYTLRTLTVQQFQRASALVIACEYLRRHSDHDLGRSPFGVGLWVGKDSTPNSFADAKIALGELDPKSSPKQLTACPACDADLEWKASEADESIGCFCRTENCVLGETFGRLPVFTVDDEIYRTPPSLLIGTVDKFAQIVRRREAAALFGIGSGKIPPDLVIQDELHLIAGPLGSLAGLLEIAVDKLCSDTAGPPKVVGSTATIRRAAEQIEAVFARNAFQFPPPALDASNSCFAREDENDSGRRYIGVSTAGRSEKFALQALSASLLQSAADPGLGPIAQRDPYWTLVAYFNSLKVLGGALVLMEDDVRVTMGAVAVQRSETLRQIETPEELTSRKKSSEIPTILRRLERSAGDPECVDVLLASNMLSVGVDIRRLGLMVVNGQPKFMAEYIQATSRVGRRSPGLVVTLYNNNKIRDRAHFEAFRSWHGALYRSVEPSSVTPFAPRARDKALHAPLVALVRHLVSPDSPRIPQAKERDVTAMRDIIVDRIAAADGQEAAPALDELNAFLEEWRSRSANNQLDKYWNDRFFKKSLLMSAETAAARRATGRSEVAAVPTPNSVRNVEPAVEYVLKELVDVPQ